MAITHRVLRTCFLRGEGVLDVANRYKLPLSTVENALRVAIKKDSYIPPHQWTIEAPQQMTIVERYGEIEIR